MSTLSKGYSGLREAEIMAMSHKELQEAVIRMFSVEKHIFSEDDSWRGSFYLPDELADAFRGRQ